MADVPQWELVLRHMKRHGKISTMQAFTLYGCTRLPARVADLKEKGINVRKTMVTKVNRYGQKTRYAEYSLK